METTVSRQTQRQTWLAEHCPDMSVCEALQNDASFRSYYRIQTPNKQFILMDSPPQLEPIDDFIKVQALLRDTVMVPTCHVVDQQLGFILLDDFGDIKYLDRLSNQAATPLYHAAIDSLVSMQSLAQTAKESLPTFNADFMMMEVERFSSWFLRQQCKIELDDATQQQLNDELQQLVKQCVDMPYTFMHRDYHSRNLMLLNNNDVGIIDFQDAMYGPLPYDLLSLLRDCYIDWPVAQVKSWSQYYLQQAIAAKVTEAVDFELFWQWFNLIGVQRHIKCIGIFARLNLRDKKPGYLNDIPRVMQYLIDELQQLEGFATIKHCVGLVQEDWS